MLTLVNLVFETPRQHFISLIQTENLDVVGPESSTINHIKYSPRGSDNDLNAFLEFSNVFTNVSASNTGVALDVHVIAQGDNDFLNLLGQFTSRGQN